MLPTMVEMEMMHARVAKRAAADETPTRKEDIVRRICLFLPSMAPLY